MKGHCDIQELLCLIHVNNKVIYLSIFTFVYAVLGTHLCAVDIPIDGEDVSRDGVNKVENPDEAEAHQQDLRCSPGGVKVPDGRGHAPQRLQVERAEEER